MKILTLALFLMKSLFLSWPGAVTRYFLKPRPRVERLLELSVTPGLSLLRLFCLLITVRWLLWSQSWALEALLQLSGLLRGEGPSLYLPGE